MVCMCACGQSQLQAQRALLIQGTESLNSASQSIERSNRIAIESEQIGTDIIDNLGQQREQLDRTRDRVRALFRLFSPHICTAVRERDRDNVYVCVR